MAFFRRPSVRWAFAVLLVGNLLFSVVFAVVDATARWGWPGLALVLPLGAVTLLCCVWSLPRDDRARNAVLLAVTLLGALALHALIPYSGMAFLYTVIYVAPFRTGVRAAVALVVCEVVAFVGISLLTGMGHMDVLGNALGLAYSVVLAFLIRQLAVTRRQSVEVAEARAREAVSAERARLAREVHDILAHSQSAQIVHLEGARLLLERGGTQDGVAALDRVNRAVRLARSGLEETRRALDVLRGEELPLTERLERLAMEFRSATGGSCAVSITGDLDCLNAGARLAVARTAQEALTNARKHAPGAAVSVVLRRLEGWCELQVRDTGGSPGRPAWSGGGYGLVGMRERAELIGGSLAAGAGAEGFNVVLRVPV
ncbi:signal transduction histidine kinase [Streptosporangium album]|uniref:histidine kinase n=1 Tax=Streptosporangium album TaxID=47479 RepID=A0A7W7S388_9ACTN|nr:histidine kinase [Streptosporangium album]MBB4943114.1 signal transduction histidine kinase [Streptosporangium album]